MKKGFTLVELLAVIVILSIIAIITIPMIKGVIDKVKLGSLEDSVYGLKKASELYFSSNGKIETTEFICSDNGCLSDSGKKLDYKGKVEGKVKLFSDGKVSICLTSDNYASSILASEKKATTKMGGCDEETYEISEVIAIEKYNELKTNYDNINSDFLSVKNNLYNKKIITDINNETQLINSDITSYSTGVNNLVASLYNKTVITSKENTFEQMKSEIDSIELGKSEEQLKNELYETLKYSDLVTEDMTYDEMREALSIYFPQYVKLNFLGTSSSMWASSGTGYESFSVNNSGFNLTVWDAPNHGIYSTRYRSYTDVIYNAGGSVITVIGSLSMDQANNCAVAAIEYSNDNINWTSKILAQGISSDSAPSSFSFNIKITIPSNYNKLYIRIRCKNGNYYNERYTRLKITTFKIDKD